MKLRYNVLCVDDEIDSLNPQKENFETVNAEVGIEICYQDIAVKPGAREDETAFKARIKGELAQKFNESTFDLILVDLHMKGGINGPDVVEWIRDSHSIYRPIIFYSAGSPATDDNAVQQLSDEANKAEILGKNLMITPRSKLSNLLETIAREMHKEEHKVNQVRGLLMDQVSEIDARIIEATRKLWLQVPEDKRASIIERVKERVKNSSNKYNKLATDIDSLAFEEILDFYVTNHKKCDANARAMILKRILDSIDGLPLSGDDFLDLYDSRKTMPYMSLTRIRNDYAHSTAQQISTDHDDNKCKYIRDESRKHLANILSLLREE